MDEKWRIGIPKQLARYLPKHLFLKGNSSACLELWTSCPKITRLSAPLIFEVSVKSSSGQARLSIPTALREANSFYFGGKVTIAGRGSYLELWPRP